MVYFYSFLLIGLFYTFGVVFISNWDAIAGGSVDGILTNYILEHFYLIFSKSSVVHTNWWTLPIFYPNVNTLATTDTLFSVAPIYIIFRSIFDYSISYSLTIMTFYILNFVVFYFILKKLKFSKILSSLGAFLYTFSYINKITVMHMQLITQFFYLGAVLALLNVSEYNSKQRNLMLFLLASFLYVCQFYSSFYLAFFIFLIAVLILILALLIKEYRNDLINFIKRYRFELISSVLLMLIFILPAVSLYLSNDVIREYSIVNKNIAYISDLFSGGTYFITWMVPKMFYFTDIEKMLMFTYALLILGFWGLLKFKKYGKFIILIFLISILFLIKFKFLNDFSLWQYIYNIVPGAIGIREPIRILLVLNGFLVVGFVNFLDKSPLKKWVLCIIALFILFEQFTFIDFNGTRFFHKEQITQAVLENQYIPDNCKYVDINFYIETENKNLVPVNMVKATLDMMWFASRKNLFFVSGYSGVSEAEGYKNKYRDELKKTPEYCVVTKIIRD